MFGIGFFELVIIAVAALVIVGPKKLPELMRQAGKLFVQVRRTTNDVRSTFDQVIKEAEDDLRKQEIEDLRNILSPSPTGNIVDTQARPHVDASPSPHVETPEGSHHYNPYDADYFKKDDTAHTHTETTTSEPGAITGENGDKK